MENIFTLGEKVTALNNITEPITVDATSLPNLEKGKEYIINLRELREDRLWYGVEGIENAVYTQDEFELKQ